MQFLFSSAMREGFGQFVSNADMAKDGRIQWDFDTLPDFPTVNGVKAHGGSMSGNGPVVAGNMIYVASGFDVTAGMPGDVVLAFEDAQADSDSVATQ